MQSLSDGFMRYFSLEMADEQAQKDQVFSIRYRVYCEEFHYESAERFPNGLEIDEYDQFSRHCLIKHRLTGAPAGCVRLVPALEGREMSLPLEKYCGESLDKELIKALSFERASVCEISRLAVDRTFRRRDGELFSRFGEIEGCVFSWQERRTFSMIAVALFLASVVMTERDKRTNVFAMMEPFLPRMMDKAGIKFKRVGRDIDFHGIRAPYFITTQSAIENLPVEYRDLYQWVRASIMGLV